MTKVKITYIISAISSVLILSGCATPTVDRIDRGNWITQMSTSPLTSGGMSYRTRHFLNIQNLLEAYESTPEKVILTMAEYIECPDKHGYSNLSTPRETLDALVELCMIEARKHSGARSVKYWMSCCLYSYRFLFDSGILPNDPTYYPLATAASVRYFNLSLSEVFSYIQKNGFKYGEDLELPIVTGRIRLKKTASDLLWEPDSFHEFFVCFDYMPENFLSHSYCPGLGVPMVARHKQADKATFDKTKGILEKIYPVTYMLTFDSFKPKNGVIDASPAFYDNFKVEDVTISGKTIPLAKDFSVMLGMLTDEPAIIDGIRFMVNSDAMGDLQGLYFVTPFDPNKIPVVLVHGLMSAPRTWTQMLNAFLGCKKIRDNFQFWFYAYPTGQPILMSASQFRKSLRSAYAEYNPDGKNPKLNDMVIIGHSMGGVVSRLSVQSSNGQELAKTLLGNEIDKFDLTPEQEEFASEVLVFDTLPFVKRVIFMATPHKGSELAAWTVVKWATKLITFPRKISQKTDAVLRRVAIASGLKEDDDPLKIATGVDNLSPDNKMVIATHNLPISKQVVVHSIIGDSEKADHKNGTDGIVPYWSSHRDGVDSELIIKSGHNVQKKSACTKEVIRILRCHLMEFDKKHPHTSPVIHRESEK